MTLEQFEKMLQHVFNGVMSPVKFSLNLKIEIIMWKISDILHVFSNVSLPTASRNVSPTLYYTIVMTKI